MILPLSLLALFYGTTLANIIQSCSYSTANTSNALENYETCSIINICPGETIIIDGCSCEGMSYLRLFDEQNIQEISSGGDKQNLCTSSATSQGSSLKYQATASICHALSLHMGCINMTSCSGSVNIKKYFPEVMITFKGARSALNQVVAPTDLVKFTADYSPFNLTSTEFTVINANAYSHSFGTSSASDGVTLPFNIVDSLSRSGDGNIVTRPPQYFNATQSYYYLTPGNFIRWLWDDNTSPEYPTSFYTEINYSPGFSRTTGNFYDFVFTVPGCYYWSNSSNTSFYVMVYDQFDYGLPHHNIKWGSYLNEYSHLSTEDDLLVFYVSDGNKQNVRIISTDTAEVVWISKDLHLPGDYDVALLPPGHYYAVSDYDNWPYMYLIVTKRQDEKKNQLIPQPYLRAAEISLFVLGVLGITDAILNWAPKPPKIPNPMGDDLSIGVLDGIENRN